MRRRRSVDLFNTAVDQQFLLPAGAIAGLVWANTGLDSYEQLVHALEFGVNDVGMAFFFALAMKEVVEATAPGGALHSPRRAATPILAAVGGMLGPALIYVALVHALGAPELARGWAIPCATDIAFSYLVARGVLGPRHPGIAFLLLLAIADDAFGLVILAAFYPAGPLRLGEFAVLFIVSLAIAWGLRRAKVVTFWPYVLGSGGVCWFALFRGGLHPALALVPVVPFLPHARRDLGLFVEAPRLHDTLNELEHWWKVPVQFILLAFGLVNAGVPFTGGGLGTVIVLAAVLAGKPIGIVGASFAARLGGFDLPRGVGSRDLVVVGCAAAIGFTVALFFAVAAFPSGPQLDAAKSGALLTVSGALMTWAAAALLRVGRFSRL
jgi:Na+:H+ antiporter, NhaA family